MLSVHSAGIVGVQLATFAHEEQAEAEVRQDEATHSRHSGLGWLRTLSAGGCLTSLRLAGLACYVPRGVPQLQRQLMALQELAYEPLPRRDVRNRQAIQADTATFESSRSSTCDH